MISERLGLVGRTALVLVSALLLQVAVVSDLPAFDAVGDLMLVMAIAAGLVGGPDRGVTYGFVAGLIFDLMLHTPFGLSALTFAVAGWAAGWLASRVIQPRWWFFVGTGLGLGMAAVVLSVVVAQILGVGYGLDDTVRMTLVVGVWTAALILPARRLWRWVYDEEEPGRFRAALS